MSDITQNWDDEVRMFKESAHALFEATVDSPLREAAERGEWPEDLWAQVVEMGFLGSAVTEASGGAGLPLLAALAPAFECGLHAVPLPVGESIVTHWLLDQLGLRPGDGILAMGLVPAGALVIDSGEPCLLTGRAERLPWCENAAQIALLLLEESAPQLVLLHAGEGILERGRNIAGEPRDTLRFERTRIDPARVVPITAALAASARHALIALRCQQMAGAMERAVTMSVTYAGERVQFGKPLAKLQAIQQYLAVMAGQAASAKVAAGFALERLRGPGEALAAATAKVRCGEAVAVVARHAHQIHGAMGFTHEHPLHWFTRRLWSWRDEFGNENHWAARLFDLVQEDGGDLWATATECRTFREDKP